MNLDLIDPRTLFNTIARPTEFIFLFDVAFWVCGLVGILIGRSIKLSRVGGTALACLVLLLALGVSEFSRHYTVTFDRGPGCTSAADTGYVTLAPIFAPEEVRPFLPSQSGFDSISCETYQELIDRHAIGHFYLSLVAYLVGLSLMYACLPVILLQSLKYMRNKSPIKVA